MKQLDNKKLNVNIVAAIGLKFIIILMERGDKLRDWFFGLSRIERLEITEEISDYIAQEILTSGDRDVGLFGELVCLEACLVGVCAELPKGYEANIGLGINGVKRSFAYNTDIYLAEVFERFQED